MFRQKVKNLDEILNQVLREEGLETPLRQRRLIASWETVTGSVGIKINIHSSQINQIR